MSGYLDKAYDTAGTEEVRALYDQWSDSYDDEILKAGYATPERIARALAAQTRNLDAPILDFGCGTGLSGAALLAQGFTCVDGADLSAEMLREANEKGVYRRTVLVGPDSDLGVTPGDYVAITATGVIGAGAAPIEVFDTLLNTLVPGGLLALSLNDHALNDPIFPERIDTALANDEARLLFKEYGPHLPGIDLKANVYILEKT